LNADEVRAGIAHAFDAFHVEWVKNGGYRYPGYLDEAEQSWVGPWAWSEADLQHRFANELDRQFASLSRARDEPHVHLEMPVRIGTRSDLVEGEPRQAVDIVLTDPGQIPRDDAELASRIFRSMTHLAFVEVKWFHKGSPRWLEKNWHDKVVAGAQPDINRLAEHVRAKRCHVAAMLLVDDTQHYTGRIKEELDWPSEVMPLVCDRSAVTDVGVHDWP
jgi:hypothetical protein